MAFNMFMPIRVMRRREELKDQRIWGSLASKRKYQLFKFLGEKSTRRADLQKKQKTWINSKSVPFNELPLPDEIFHTIFLLLSAKSICILQCVCKKSRSLIQSTEFIESQRKQSETVLISKKTFHHDGDLPKSYFHFVDFENGKDNFIDSTVNNLIDVFASCDGLILGSANENRSLILVNPITSKHKTIPSGTIGFVGSYSLVFCRKAKTYKVVHLFRESPECTVCEILNVITRKWMVIDGPSSHVLNDIKQIPVSVGGFLYWMPRKHCCDYLLLLDVGNGIFTTKKLPIFCTKTDRLVEIGGVVGFVTHAKLSLIQVWVLTKTPGGGNEYWVKRYSFYMGFDARLVVPICSSGNGKEIVFEYPDKDLYVHNLETNNKTRIYSRNNESFYSREGAEILFIPHRNTLVSWDHHP